MHVCMLALHFAELVKRSSSDTCRDAGLLPVFVLPGGKLLVCLLSLSYTLETLAIVHDT